MTDTTSIVRGLQLKCTPLTNFYVASRSVYAGVTVIQRSDHMSNVCIGGFLCNIH